jgi:pimeloyl-ACP methyl ester carboxylesterase
LRGEHSGLEAPVGREFVTPQTGLLSRVFGHFVSVFEVQLERVGSGPRVVLVHGSVTGPAAWNPQRGLADAYTLVLVTRPGFGEGEQVDRVDFEEHARLLAEVLEPGDHLVGHSYGGVVCLYAAAARPGLRSLTLAEPPAFRLAGPRPETDAFVRLWRDGPREPRAFHAAFLELVGSELRLPDPLPPALARGARTLRVERGPWAADPPLAELAAAPYPKLVVSGAHSELFEQVCDELERRLGAERAVLPGAGHSLQRAPGFTERLRDFLDRAETGVAPF